MTKKISKDQLRSLREGQDLVFVTTTEGGERKYPGRVWQLQGHRIRLQIPEASPPDLLWSLLTNQPIGSRGHVGGQVWLEWPN